MPFQQNRNRINLFVRHLADVSWGALLFVGFMLAAANLTAQNYRHTPLALSPADVLATGNEWIALPEIEAADGSLASFNVLSMRDRGLLQVNGERGKPALQPYFTLNGKPLNFSAPTWELIEYWIPVAHFAANGLTADITYCAPPGSRGAFLHMTMTNHGGTAQSVSMGVKASWGALSRVTYLPVELRGDRSVMAAPWVDSAEVYSFTTDDTQFAWSLMHEGAQAQVSVPPFSVAPAVDAQRSVQLQPGETAEANFILGAGVEEFSASHNAKALREIINRSGAQAIIDQTAAWCKRHTRTTGQADLDSLMNRNYLFTTLYAWGRTIDTEQFVGVTSRSPRYYVSAAYWDRDAMIWSFPGLLDTDPAWAREALDYALSIQLRNTGIHSRFIDGIVLEDGLELDEVDAPILAFASYVRTTNDQQFLLAHRAALLALDDRLARQFDPAAGLYISLQDSQDEYQKRPFLTYDNVLSWRALLDLSELFDRLGDRAKAQELTRQAATLHTTIMKAMVSDSAPGAGGPIFVCATDGKNPLFADIPPGSLLKLPALGFISQDDPLFVRTFQWLHSKNYEFSHAGDPYGIPGSYRLPFTTSWMVADELSLNEGRAQALKILRTSRWDAGIITEGVNPQTAVMDSAGRAFATAAGYMAHAICKNFCEK